MCHGLCESARWSRRAFTRTDSQNLQYLYTDLHLCVRLPLHSVSTRMLSSPNRLMTRPCHLLARVEGNGVRLEAVEPLPGVFVELDA